MYYKLQPCRLTVPGQMLRVKQENPSLLCFQSMGQGCLFLSFLCLFSDYCYSCIFCSVLIYLSDGCHIYQVKCLLPLMNLVFDCDGICCFSICGQDICIVIKSFDGIVLLYTYIIVLLCKLSPQHLLTYLFDSFPITFPSR